MWQIIIGHCQHINKILPFVSIIDRLLKIDAFDKAIVFSLEPISLLEPTAVQIQPIIDECDLGIYNLVKKFLEFKKLKVIF